MIEGNSIQVIFEKHGGVMKTSQLLEYGIYYNKIKKLLEEGSIEQIRRGYYQYVDEHSFSDILAIVKLFPDGILCMESALDYYGYTERTPGAWHIAVDSRSTRTRFYIEYPLVKPHFIIAEKLFIGVDSVEMDGIAVSIYDRERTLCDCLLHRNKLDAEVFNCAIQSYVRDDKRNSARLAEYAKALHVEKKVKEVLGIWL